MRVKVSDVMTRDVTSVKWNTPFKDVAEALIAKQISAVPVLDEEGHVQGIVSEADLLNKEEFREQFYREGYRPPLRARLRHRLSQEGGTPRDKARGDVAGEIMTAPAITVPPHMSLVAAARLMDERGVKRLPVIDSDGCLVGILSRRDLVKIFVRPDDDIAREVREEVLGRQLWVETEGVIVTVLDGVVTLSGRMDRRSEAQLAARMTGRVGGVVDVVDRLEWDEDDAPVW